MKRLIVVAVLLFALASTAGAEVWGGYTVGFSTLTIERNPIDPLNLFGDWQWTYTVVRGAETQPAFHSFTVGLAPGAENTGGIHIWDMAAGGNIALDSNFGVTAIPRSMDTTGNAAGTMERATRLEWYFGSPGGNGNALTNGETAWFSFKTDWDYVSLADHIVADGLGRLFADKQTPAPYIPEPYSVALGLMGLGTLTGLRRLIRK